MADRIEMIQTRLHERYGAPASGKTAEAVAALLFNLDPHRRPEAITDKDVERACRAIQEIAQAIEAAARKRRERRPVADHPKGRSEADRLLCELVEWAAFMGGFGSEEWRRAKRYTDRLRDREAARLLAETKEGPPAGLSEAAMDAWLAAHPDWQGGARG